MIATQVPGHPQSTSKDRLPTEGEPEGGALMRSLMRAALMVSVLLVTARAGLAASCKVEDSDGSKVLAARQAAEATCPCASATDHGAYVSCVAGVANTLS